MENSAASRKIPFSIETQVPTSLDFKDRRHSGRTQRRTLPGSYAILRFGTWCQNSWAIEYAALILSFACLIVIFSLGLCFNNQPSHTWHSSLSISTVLSILATMLKSTVLSATASALGQLKWAWYSGNTRSLFEFQVFDSASRGPFGAFILLWSIRGSVLPGIGALIIIIALGSDAAIQASTSQLLRPQFSPTASIPITVYYDNSIQSLGPQTGSPWIGQQVDPLLKSALHTGVFTSEFVQRSLGSDFRSTNYSVTPFCGTGNCTFTPYSSLTVQHQCQNITNSLQFSPGNLTGIDTGNLSLSIFPSLSHSYYKEQVTMTLSNWSLIGKRDDDMWDGVYPDAQFRMGCNIPTLVEDLSIAGLGGPSNTSDRLPIAEVFMITFSKSSSATLFMNHYQAYRCNLDLGMQTFTASVDQGRLTETSHEFTRGNWTLGNDAPTAEDAHGKWYWSLRRTINNDDHEVRIGYDEWSNIVQYLNEYYTGDVPINDYGSATNDLGNLLWAAEEANRTSGLNAVFGAMAQSLSRYFRTVSGDTAKGVSEELEQYIQLQWEWLLVPSVLVALNAFFVLAVRLQSGRLGIPYWRNSALALLPEDSTDNMTGSNDILHEDHILIGPPRSINRISELETRAKAQMAKLKSKSWECDQLA